MYGSRTVLLAAALVFCVPGQAPAFGNKGHRSVGGIADQRLAGKPVAEKLDRLLDGLSLADVATLTDAIKPWDKHDPDTDLDTFHLPLHPVIEQDLRAFHKANKKQHRDFHYTDVPVVGNSTYKTGTTGRSEIDIVHMIPFCIKVLKGSIPETNDRKITKRVAVILLAHYFGDNAQPLHIGAMYFDANGKPVNPDAKSGPAFGDEGGNQLTLFLRTPGGDDDRHSIGTLHGFWDNDAVDGAFDLVTKEIRAERPQAGMITSADIVRRLATKEPADWKMPADLPVEDWSLRWADEMMPLAREAHERLQYSGIHIDHHRKTAGGRATEKEDPPGGVSYRDFASKATRANIHKAGWRLADLLERILVE